VTAEIQTLAPLHALRLRTPRLELRLPTPEELRELALVAQGGVHPPETMPFRVAWTDSAGEPGFVETFIAFHEEQRASWRPERWHLLLGVWAEGEPAGSQAVQAEDFAVSRTVATGSWLGERFQRRGYGTEMRSAVLELAFAGLGAERARSGAIEGNVASARVSEKLGYEQTGEHLVFPRGEALREFELELTRDRWLRTRRAGVRIEGLAPCLQLFGLPLEGGGG
jgi:RimJ/RimL family protein N-acetyltransferase